MGSALVLGGGGVTGIAWTTGLLLGLAEAALDLTQADRVIGTSAGATVGAQVTSGRTLGELYAAQLSPATAELAADLDLEVLGPIFTALGSGEPLDQDERARIGGLALAAATVPEPVRREVIEVRVGTDAWPDRDLRVTAVDARTGELVVFDSSSGVGLIDAVAASCAVPGVWPPVTIGDRRFVDGGIRSVANADLADGCDPVLVVLPLAGVSWAAVQEELAGLTGARSLVLTADAEASEAMGLNPLDPSRRRPAAEAGRRQAATLVDAVRQLWQA